MLCLIGRELYSAIGDFNASLHEYDDIINKEKQVRIEKSMHGCQRPVYFLN